jgi:hypothetical protein
MSTYSEVLSQAQNLTLEEQQQLLEVLSALVRDREQPKLRVNDRKLMQH